MPTTVARLVPPASCGSIRTCQPSSPSEAAMTLASSSERDTRSQPAPKPHTTAGTTMA
jgi:hypothetical protein